MFYRKRANVILRSHQNIQPGEQATLRVYLANAAKRAVVVKDDDLLTKKEMQEHHKEAAAATLTEIKTWLNNQRFKKCLLRNAQHIMTSHYVAKWKWVQIKNTWTKIIRMRLVLRGFMDLEAFFP